MKYFFFNFHINIDLLLDKIVLDNGMILRGEICSRLNLVNFKNFPFTKLFVKK
jgi:hypothetical protein